MLIIKGADFTSSVTPNPQPPAQETVYNIYYMSENGTMFLDRSNVSDVHGVGVIVNNPTEKDITSVSVNITSFQDIGVETVVLCHTILEKGGESFIFDTSEWVFTAITQSGAPNVFPPGVVTLMITLSKSSFTSTLPNEEVDAIVAAIPTAITFDN